MTKIPINFELDGKRFSGYFHKVAGAGSTALWHLHDEDHYYLGMLRYTDKWVFDGNKPSEWLEPLAEYLGAYLASKIDSAS